MALLQIENLTFQYPESKDYALQNVTFSVGQGELILLCGVSGCGKSTLFKLIKHELAPFGRKGGNISYDTVLMREYGKDMHCCEIGLVQQDPESQIVTDKVWHELAFGLENLGVSQNEMRRRVAEIAAYFDIESVINKKTSELSGGQKQILNLASVMIMQPKLLLLDEPTAQLDPIAAAEFISAVYKLNREFGLTVIISEHRLEDVLPIADRVLLMNNGKLEYNGSARGFPEFFVGNTSHPMACALTASAKIYGMLGGTSDFPLTVREGRQFIIENYGNAVRSLPEKIQDMPPKILLKAKNLYFRYQKDDADILKDLSFDIRCGEHICILGGNGAGKTTFLLIMSGLLKPYRGCVVYKNKKISRYSDRELYHCNMAMLPQDPQTVFVKNSVYDELIEICKSMGTASGKCNDSVQEIAKRFGISHLLKRHPYDLSGGEQQKAALAKLILLQPEVLLLDEPTKGIDSCSKKQIADILNLLKNDGMTIVTVTHDVEFAAENADRCAFLFDGEIVSCQVPRKFFSSNAFYTTGAGRITRNYYDNTVLCDEVAALCRINGKRAKHE